MTQTLTRCEWRGMAGDPLYEAYHDTEWGVPEYDSRALWEKLVLDGFQAGLAWITILRKREAFRAAFQGFDPEVVARYGEADRARLMADAGIIRSNAKIDAAISGAKVYLAMRDRGDDFAVEVSKALKAKGFKFVGPVIVYAWMQAVGIVNDHLVTCYRHEPIRRM